MLLLGFALQANPLSGCGVLAYKYQMLDPNPILLPVRYHSQIIHSEKEEELILQNMQDLWGCMRIF